MGHVLRNTGPSVSGTVHLAFKQQFTGIESASLWEESLPHTRLHSAHIPVVLSVLFLLPKMFQWSSKRREERHAGVNLMCRPGEAFSYQILKKQK